MLRIWEEVTFSHSLPWFCNSSFLDRFSTALYSSCYLYLPKLYFLAFLNRHLYLKVISKPSQTLFIPVWFGLNNLWLRVHKGHSVPAKSIMQLSRFGLAPVMRVSLGQVILDGYMSLCTKRYILRFLVATVTNHVIHVLKTIKINTDDEWSIQNMDTLLLQYKFFAKKES